MQRKLFSVTTKYFFNPISIRSPNIDIMFSTIIKRNIISQSQSCCNNSLNFVCNNCL